MKQIINIIIALTTLIALGCSNGDNISRYSTADNSVVTLGLEPCRTIIGESIDGKRSLYWSSGDRISINGEVSNEAQIVGEKASVATFTFANEIGYPRNILYPAAFYTSATSVTLPRIQEFGEGAIATNTLPMAAKATSIGDYPKLYHLAAVVHLQLKADGEPRDNVIRKVEFRGRNNEQVSGVFLIDYESVTLTSTKSYPAVVEGDEKSDYSEVVPELVTGSRVTGELSTENVTDVFVVVPAREYERGFSIRVINDSGHYMDKAKQSGLTLSKGEIYNLPVIEYKPTGTLVNVEL